MRYLVLSDLHGNLQALEAVLADAAGEGYDQTLILGDLVGYGADPEAVITRTFALGSAALIRGNHDKVCAGLASAYGFNDIAQRSIAWTRMVLPPALLDRLAAMPAGPLTVTDDIEICHGAPFDEDYYIFDSRDASRAFVAVSRPICLFGHTHLPSLFIARAGYGMPVEPDEDGEGWTWTVPRDAHVLINVGSVGQPRDGDPRAAYGLLDTTRRTIRVRRVDYDITGAQRRILDAGLPEWLAARLEKGG